MLNYQKKGKKTTITNIAIIGTYSSISEVPKIDLCYFGWLKEAIVSGLNTGGK